MTSSVEEDIIAATIAALNTINGVAPFRVNLAGLAIEEDTSTIVKSAPDKPLVVVGFDGIDSGESLRSASVALNIDVSIQRAYWILPTVNLTPQRAIARIASDVRLAMHTARNVPGSPLNISEWRGTRRHRGKDGAATENGVTLTYSITYTDVRVT